MEISLNKEKSNTAVHRKRRIALGILCGILLATAIFCAVYVNDYYPADEEAIAALSGKADCIEIYEMKQGVTVFEPLNAEAGFIFYPGGKVEAAAYVPLMEALAVRNILAVLCDMPFNLAVLDVNKADGIRDAFPKIDDWYIGGHSLGGSMAASYLNKQGGFDGLILLGSYSTSDVSDTRVLSVFGSEDGVMNREKYEKYKSNLPKDYTEIIIDGGCHAYFGMYGEQEGDGKPEITPIQQIIITADHIKRFVEG